MQKDDLYISKSWDYSEKKKNNYLLVWSDIPAWMVVDKELFSLLKMFDGKNSIQMIVEHIVKYSSKSKEEIMQNLQRIITVLLKSNVISNINDNKNHYIETQDGIYILIIHITNRCNLKCVMCCNDGNIVKKEEEIDIALFRNFLDDAFELCNQECTVSFVGGEPLIVADKTLELAEYAKKIGFKHVSMSTNAILMNEEIAKKAKKIGMYVQVSIDGATKEQHELIRGRGNFEKAISGIKILKKEEVYTATNFLCHSGNVDSLEDYYNLALSLKVDKARFSPLKRIGAGVRTKLEAIPVDQLIEKGYQLYKNHPEFRKLMGEDYFSAFANTCRLAAKYYYCGSGLTTIVLNSDGFIYPCSGHALPEFRAGNIKDKSFRRIWSNSPILNKIREVYKITSLNEKCSKCIVKHWCQGGCRAEAYHTTRRMDSPALECENIKKTILKMFWILSENPDLGQGDFYSFD